jgi:hypothetical protein
LGAANNYLAHVFIPFRQSSSLMIKAGSGRYHKPAAHMARRQGCQVGRSGWRSRRRIFAPTQLEEIDQHDPQKAGHKEDLFRHPLILNLNKHDLRRLIAIEIVVVRQ